MLTTNLRFTQTLDPTGRPRSVDGTPTLDGITVTAPAYQGCATRPSTARPSTATAGWSFIGFDAMSKVDLHPNRWPLHSTS